MNKLSPQAVIFDLGSTLVDFPVTNWDTVSRECTLAGYRHLLESDCKLPGESEFLAGFEQVRAVFRQQATDSHKEWTVVEAAQRFFVEIGLPVQNGLADKFFDSFYGELEKHLSLYDDTIDVLTRIRGRFPKVGLISNTIFPERVHHREFQRFGLKSFFDFAIFSSTFGLRKPHPSIFNEAAKLAGVKTSDCVYIGDRYLEDAQGSSGAGMHSILKIIPGREYPTEFPQSQRKITDLSDLSKHLDI
ncbi:MAG TPA: HAD family hydrolase [candidate division Zixibacteria bacterium]|nr:HAD family hydrolase [candidate division Zixibacteria bacterium]